MKKILAFVVMMLMVLSAVPMALAQDTAPENETTETDDTETVEDTTTDTSTDEEYRENLSRQSFVDTYGFTNCRFRFEAVRSFSHGSSKVGTLRNRQ